MARPWWWERLTRLRPVERELAREISDALVREFEPLSSAHQAAVGQNQELRQSLSQLRHDESVLAQQLREAEDRAAESERRIAEQARANDVLRQQVAAADARRWREVLAPGTGPVRARPSSSGSACDCFLCLDCGSFLLLETPEPRFRRAVGTGCDTCTDLPAARPPEPASVVESLAVAATDVDLTVRGTRQEREKIAAELVAGLVRNPPLDVAAEAYAKKAAELTRKWTEEIAPTRASGLDVIAAGLDKVPDTVKSGVVWCATELLGAPDFLAAVLGHVVADLVTDPLHLKDIALAIRVVDTVVCALDGDLGTCASVRDLAIMDVGEAETADALKVAVDRLRAALDMAMAHQALPELRELALKPEMDPPWLRGGF